VLDTMKSHSFIGRITKVLTSQRVPRLLNGKDAVHADCLRQATMPGVEDARAIGGFTLQPKSATTMITGTRQARDMDGLPNVPRLSCGATWTISQTADLHSKTAPAASSAC